MMKRFVFFIVLSTLCLGILYAQQLTRVGIVDLPRVYTTFFRDSRAVREFEERRTLFEREVTRMTTDIRNLQTRRADAIQRDDQAEVIRLDNEIHRRSENLRNFHQARTEQLETERRGLMQSGTFLNDVHAAIRFVAESEGYTLVLDSKATPGIIWNSMMIDITDNVIRRLQASSR
jgi:outer membrane protein